MDRERNRSKNPAGVKQTLNRKYADKWKGGEPSAAKGKSGRRPELDGKSGRRTESTGKTGFGRKTDQGDKRIESTAAPKKKSLCPVQKKCGSCQMLDMPYQAQLTVKQKNIEELLKKYCTVHPIIGMKDPFHYRNKVHAVFGYEKGKVISGTYKENTHILVPVETCMIEDQKADEIIGTIRGLLKSFKIRTYDEDTGYGLLRHVLVKHGFATGEIMVVLVTSSPVFPSKNNFVKALRDKHPEITTIIQNLNNRNTTMVLGDKEKNLYGNGYIEDVLCGFRFRISSKSFYQVNPVQTEILYNKAIQLAKLTGKETVVDAYCGIGTIGIIASKSAGKVVGVELNKDAVRDAISNAKENQIENIQFYANDAGKFMVEMAQQRAKVDVVFMDPPRSGSTEEFMDSIGMLNPKRVVYISCNPVTLERDLAYFRQIGYKAEEAWPVDLFPMTGHVETVVLLSKGDIDSTRVRVEFPLDDMDITYLRGKVTYDQIKAYVEEQTGLKVSNLYISQIKRKCGLEVGENYNKPKSEDSKVPNCPIEKEQAIMDALKHFGLIK